jgi:hypothetical protein
MGPRRTSEIDDVAHRVDGYDFVLLEELQQPAGLPSAF